MTVTTSSPASAATSTPARRQRQKLGDLKVAMIFLAPATLGFVVFYIWPTLRGAYLSFTEYSLLQPPEFNGLQNYERMVQDSFFWNALVVTVEYVVINIGLQTVLAVFIAMLMYRLTKSITVRAVILLPYLIANVVVALVWYWMLDFQVGIVNQALTWVGIDPIAFFGESHWAIPTVAGINIWRHMGYTALLVFAGLQMIPSYVYEAAEVDGSSEWQTFWRITLPLLRPVLVMVLVVTMIGSFQVFDTIAVTTQGGPINATRVIYFYIYERAFTRFDFGYASAMAMVLFAILAVVSLLQLRLLRAKESDLA
ncbi:binding-protein-dependent transport systems inner membrane component [Kribbella flavida DSM 17836]|uniref:Binding-protein-dependent transport systems inner membrane component n=1 Tax=Kribbella flavida (strain DSM 17836 / JCM 10339 / NBRC 14399) TaxID=479435 RepID=D2PNJ3_KRIFD|nr:sugar ABC transporter permease [Kribbella flavida]ADB30845.1 binding-protein-dependent transport systems inner membrane component [Kribbella flavida DSM 17836]